MTLPMIVVDVCIEIDDRDAREAPEQSARAFELDAHEAADANAGAKRALTLLVVDERVPTNGVKKHFCRCPRRDDEQHTESETTRKKR